MKMVKWNARCPFELGDTIFEGDKTPRKITDIATTHYLKTGKIVFSYELDNSSVYQRNVKKRGS